MLTPAISASRTSVPSDVIIANAFSTPVIVPPFLNRLPFADETTTGFAGPRMMTVGPCARTAAAAPTVVTTKVRRVILLLIGGQAKACPHIGQMPRCGDRLQPV